MIGHCQHGQIWQITTCVGLMRRPSLIQPMEIMQHLVQIRQEQPLPNVSEWCSVFDIICQPWTMILTRPTQLATICPLVAHSHELRRIQRLMSVFMFKAYNWPSTLLRLAEHFKIDRIHSWFASEMQALIGRASHC